MFFKLVNSPGRVMVRLFSVLFIILFLLPACAPKEESNTDNPVPAITTISPTGKVSHLPSFILTIEGTGFVSDSAIVFNGVMKRTEYINAKRLSCTINPADIPVVASTLSSAELALPASDHNVVVLVRSPLPGGGDSKPVNFVVHSNHIFPTPVALTAGNLSYLNPSMVIQDAGNICMAYEFFDSLSKLYAIDFVRSNESGGGWVSPVRIVQTSKGCYNPKLALDSEGRITIVFFAEERLYFARSTDNGTTWSYPVVISPLAYEPLEAAFAIDRNGGFNVIWPQWVEGWNYQVLFTRSTDNGVTWSSVINIYSGWKNSSDAYSPTIAVDANNGIFAAWAAWPTGGSRYDFVYSNYSLNNGATWQSVDTSYGVSKSPNLAINSNGNIYMVLSAAVVPFRYGIAFKKSVDRGTTWAPQSYIKEDGWNSSPHMKIDRAGNLNVIYETDGKYYFTRSLDDGSTWSQPILIINDSGVLEMALDYWGNIYVTYESGSSGQLYFTSSK